MNPEQIEFAKKYHHKLVKPLGNCFNIPIKEYIVVAALLNHEDDGKTTVLVFKATDYSPENPHLFTFKIAVEDLEKSLADIEIIRDGYEEFVKPVILGESLISHVKDEGDDWGVAISDYYRNGAFIEGLPETKYFKVPKTKDKPDAAVGLEEYMIVYKSIFDLGKPSVYIFKITENLESMDQVIEWVKPFRQDVLDNLVVYGQNQRFIKNEPEVQTNP